MKMFRATAAGVLVMLSQGAFATPEEARRVLQESAEAIKNTETITAEVVRFAELPAEDTTADLMARRTGQRGDELRPWAFRITGSARPGGRDETVFDVYRLSDTLRWIDHDRKLVRDRTERTARRDPEQFLTSPLIPADIFGSEPFARVLQAEDLSMGERVTVDGVECDVVVMPVPGGIRRTKFYIGVDDRLPRRVEDAFSVSGEINISGSITTTYRNLAAGTEVSMSQLEISAPDGYRDEAELRAARPDLNRAAEEPGEEVDQVRRAPAFTLSDIHGDDVSLEDLRGRVGVLMFFGTWAPPAVRAAPDLDRIARHYEGKPVEAVALSFRERDPAAPKKFVNDNDYRFRMLLEADQVRRDYGVRVFPTFVIVGFEGQIIGTVDSYRENETYNNIRSIIDEYLERAEGGQSDAEAAGG